MNREELKEWVNEWEKLVNERDNLEQNGADEEIIEDIEEEIEGIEDRIKEHYPNWEYLNYKTEQFIKENIDHWVYFAGNDDIPTEDHNYWIKDNQLIIKTWYTKDGEEETAIYVIPFEDIKKDLNIYDY